MDVFALSSENEGLSITILEAMASGKPVIATDVGGNPEIIVNHKTGLLVQSNYPSGMSEAIISLLNDNRKAISMGKEAEKSVIMNFNINTMVDNISDLYLRLLAGKRKIVSRIQG